MTRWGQGRNYRLYTQATRTLPRHCQHCGATNNLELDHITNLAAGGTDTIDNLQWLCQVCHRTKTQAESRQGIARRSRYRQAPPHPGG